MNRTEFLPRHLEYLFSFDLDLRNGRRERAPIPSSNVITSHAAEYDEATAPLYNALGETRVMGEAAIGGYVECAQERVEFIAGQDFGEIAGRLVIRTSDRSVIEASYTGVLRAGARWQLLRGDYGSLSAKEPVLETKAHISIHFETGSTKYRWLVQHQCVGYGCLNLARGEPTWTSFDVYALGVRSEHAVRQAAL